MFYYLLGLFTSEMLYVIAFMFLVSLMVRAMDKIATRIVWHGMYFLY